MAGYLLKGTRSEENKAARCIGYVLFLLLPVAADSICRSISTYSINGGI
jgi:hypothetical protein